METTDTHDAAAVPTYAELKAQRDALQRECNETADFLSELQALPCMWHAAAVTRALIVKRVEALRGGHHA